MMDQALCRIRTNTVILFNAWRGHHHNDHTSDPRVLYVAFKIKSFVMLLSDEDYDQGLLYERIRSSKIGDSKSSWKVPNTFEFADWIGWTKQKQIRVTGFHFSRCLTHLSSLIGLVGRSKKQIRVTGLMNCLWVNELFGSVRAPTKNMRFIL